jgi:hypothetical protein
MEDYAATLGDIVDAARDWAARKYDNLEEYLDDSGHYMERAYQCSAAFRMSRIEWDELDDGDEMMLLVRLRHFD